MSARIVRQKQAYRGLRGQRRCKRKKENRTPIVSGTNHEPERVSEEKAMGKISPSHIGASIASTALSGLRPFYPFIYPLQMATVIFTVLPVFRRAEESFIEENKLRV